jgi:AmmeMemoRadiSam system protein B
VASPSSRPRLRPIETIVVQDRRLGRALMLRDTQGVTSSQAVLPMEVLPIASRFTGTLTCEEIARQASKEIGERIPVEVVVRLATELEEALFVDGAPYRRERARIEREFADADVREASHAGGAYHDDPDLLTSYIEEACLGAEDGAPAPAPKRKALNASAKRANGASSSGASGSASASASASGRADAGGRADASAGAGRLVGLVAPHIDPWRGARCYGAAYRALSAALPKDADTFILVGTSHAPMREPFALCRKAFATPLGPIEADRDSIDAIAKACDFDPYADQFNHKREHSLEFQAVFLRHLLDKTSKRTARIIPILAGLGRQQQSGESPASSSSVERFLDAVREVIAKTRAVVIAGADLAHVGPRFGDPRPFDEDERGELEETDRRSLAHAEKLDAEAFWEHVSRDLDTRRVCGLGPMYSLLRTIDPKAKGDLRHYEQNVDPDEGSIVSHAALGFYV